MKMIYAGGKPADAGNYWNPLSGLFVGLKNKATLPETGNQHYLKVPGFVFVILAALISLVYIITLPFVGLAVIIYLLAVKAGIALRGLFLKIGG